MVQKLLVAALLTLFTPVASRADSCETLCARLKKEEPRNDRERKLDQIGFSAYESCVNRSRGSSATVNTQKDADALVKGMMACDGVHMKACVDACRKTK